MPRRIIHVCNLPDDVKIIGNATKEFKSLDGAQKAIDVMHKYEINGRDIVVREEFSKDRDRLNLGNSNIRPTTQSESAWSDLVREIEREGPITNSIFISNLDSETSKHNLIHV